MHRKNRLIISRSDRLKEPHNRGTLTQSLGFAFANPIFRATRDNRQRSVTRRRLSPQSVDVLTILFLA